MPKPAPSPPKYYPAARRNGVLKRVHQHRAEAVLGRALVAPEQIHHATASIAKDAPIVICQDMAYHKLLHIRTRVLYAGGNPNTDKICSSCQLVKPLTAFRETPVRSRGRLQGRYGYCFDCQRAKYDARNERRRRDRATS